MNHVTKYSPYNGATFLVHLMIADVVNEEHRYEFYGAQDRLAQKCRLNVKTVRRSLDQLVADGWLLEHKRGRYDTVLFRFVFKDSDVVYDPNEVNIGLTRWTFDDNEGKSRPDEGTECRTNSIEQKETQPLSIKSDGVSDVFDEFWSAYPRKLGKAKAKELFLKALKEGVEPVEIIRGLEWWKRGEWRGKEERYIPHAQTWLNQKRWLDADDASTMPSLPSESRSNAVTMSFEATTAHLDEVAAVERSMSDETRAALRALRTRFSTP